MARDSVCGAVVLAGAACDVRGGLRARGREGGRGLLELAAATTAPSRTLRRDWGLQQQGIPRRGKKGGVRGVTKRHPSEEGGEQGRKPQISWTARDVRWAGPHRPPILSYGTASWSPLGPSDRHKPGGMFWIGSV